MSIINSDYDKCIDLSERVAWRVDDVVSSQSRLDFNKPFMPSAMDFARTLPFLTSLEKLQLNQIFGNAYSYLFYFVETYIIVMAMDSARAELHGEESNLRALLRFAEEEVKHQQMFLRFNELFKLQFGTECRLAGDSQAVAKVILSKSPMGVLLTTLHLELITQAHYIDCIKDSQEVDDLFRSLFKHHWLEESQHAKLDVLELLKLRRKADEAQVQQAVDDYFGICSAFEELLAAQAKLDVGSLELAAGRTFPESKAAAIEAAQRRSYQRAFLYCGLTNTMFQEFLSQHFPQAVDRAARLAKQLAK